MDRTAVSAIALLATAFAINQHQPVGNGAAAAAHAEIAGTQTGHSQSRTEKPPAAAALDPVSACGIGSVCDALNPYRETGPWTACCAWFGSRGQPIPNRAESLRLNSNAPERLGKEAADWCLPVKNPPALSFLI